MARWIKGCGYDTSSAVITIILCIQLVSMSGAVQASRTGLLGIANDFGSPTQFTCHSNKMARQSYTASPSEIYYFAFDTSRDAYWDCQVRNDGWRILDTFRFYGNHAGPELWGCTTCVWVVNQAGIYFYHDGKWIYEHSWH
ncbi:hypothetical protein KC19_4G154600 [Ceratodon purpureus]|uniref:S-protein homolog n=1 Tax=Ceratodon purpureus TaxID=3225 RepID=A0A8T0ICL8_CERPU|nr:hypothetical protein KC19_4G154600 [Ceratodon purpureus]